MQPGTSSNPVTTADSMEQIRLIMKEFTVKPLLMRKSYFPDSMNNSPHNIVSRKFEVFKQLSTEL